MKNETALGHVLTLMTIIIWGTTFVSTKVLLEAFTPIEILFFRFIIEMMYAVCIVPVNTEVRCCWFQMCKTLNCFL